ncbi:condensation domain-containing protein [Halothiobacillus sp.]|uniref:condensation domain-containing protein n=1 Tax=Halothiobacillus sp. TaxID=1891311 RepID=UPI002623266D|nr:condensation domain-containing protein [Halothiobacillus sp.]MDD4965748.1 condensation domain-containing protein [Halothiobacillus sp.]
MAGSDDKNAVVRYPLSPTQSGMLLRTLMRRNEPVDVEQIVLRLGTKLDHATLQKAWGHLVADEPILRTYMNWRTVGGPFQEVVESVNHGVKLIELPDNSEQEITRLSLESRNTPFDIEVAPLARLMHIICEDCSILVWTLHHILFDGRSYVLLLDALFRTYRQILAGQIHKVPLYRPFREFIASLETLDREAAKSHWQRIFNEYTPLSSLCQKDLPRSNDTETEVAVVKRLSAADTQALVQWSEQHGVTLVSTLYGLWCTTLSILTGSLDIVFGVTLAGRHVNGEVFDGLGLYINTLPLRWTGHGNRTFAETAVDLRKQILALRPYVQTSLTDIHRWVGIAPGYHLFETLVVYDHQSLETRLNTTHPSFSDCRVEEYGSTGFPLTLVAFGSPVLETRVIGDPSCISQAKAVQVIELLHKLARAIPRHTPQPIAQLVGQFAS